MSDWMVSGIVAVLFGVFFWTKAPAYAEYQMKGRESDGGRLHAHLAWARAVAVVFVASGLLMMASSLGR